MDFSAFSLHLHASASKWVALQTVSQGWRPPVGDSAAQRPSHLYCGHLGHQTRIGGLTAPASMSAPANLRRSRSPKDSSPRGGRRSAANETRDEFSALGTVAGGREKRLGRAHGSARRARCILLRRIGINGASGGCRQPGAVDFQVWQHGYNHLWHWHS